MLGILIGAATLYFYLTLYPMLPIGTGYAAKKMCSCHFIAGRSQESIQKDDLAMSPLNLTSTVLDKVAKTATASIFGLGTKTAVYRENLGCILLDGKDDYNVQLKLPEVKQNITAEWPIGETISQRKMAGVNYPALNQAINNVFDPSLNMDSIKTRAVVVVHKDSLIAEKYANGFDKDTEILGWSMNKSITSTLIGILVKAGKMKLTDDQLYENWTDERSKITINDLLQMQSGLAFEENYAEVSDVTKMLFMNEDIVKEVAKNPLGDPIGTKWYYSSGTTNLVAGLIKKQFDNPQDYLKFPHEQLFRKIGMHSMVLETDESGNYIGSSYGYATPRDWAKLGLLYLNEGNWYGEQIVDTSWVNFTRQPAEHSGGIYGGHFWHNHDHAAYKDVPTDIYSCNGFEGQYVYIIPSKDLVVVRMGLNQGEEYDANGFLRDVIKAIEGS
ncbi:MAG: serine hydrolase domain-containing protein [Saprospiraceae bacterium]